MNKKALARDRGRGVQKHQALVKPEPIFVHKVFYNILLRRFFVKVATRRMSAVAALIPHKTPLA
jgi:hypothetical protein